MEDPLVIFSCDGHVGPLVEEYRPYLESGYRDMLDEVVEEEKRFLQMQKMFNLNNPHRLAVVDERDTIKNGGMTSSWDADRRIKELDAEGVAAEVLYPGTTESMMPFFYFFNRPYPDDVRMAGARAYHRWLADFIAPSKGRLIGTAEPGPAIDLDETLAELHVVAKQGFRAVFIPGHVYNASLPPFFDPHFEPFWAACNDLGLVLTIHAGWGTKQGEFTKLIDETVKLYGMMEEDGSGGFLDKLEGVMNMMNSENPESIFSLDVAPRRALWQIIFSGVFDRYPNLKLVITECRADWVPQLKSDLDKHFLSANKRPRLKMKPSDYFGRNVFVAPSSPRRFEVEMRQEIGLDNFMFATDFPHPEGTWPNTLTWLRAVFHDTPEADLRAILGGNAIRAYGLDKNWLSGIAAKIGHKPRDIIGDYKVDERLIADFDYRSQFSSPTPPVDQRDLESKLDNDLLASASAA